MQQKPYLSVVAVSRNDDHGGDPLVRTQIFINCLAMQADLYKFDIELIIVEWNPVEGRSGLSEVLSIPNAVHFTGKVITVPSEIHEKFKCSQSLNLFQMIGKNVGIRRANGEFVLATNIDVLFSNELIEFIARRNLSTQNLYRVDRFDIQAGLDTNFSLDEALKFAWMHPIRMNKRYKPRALVGELYPDEGFVKNVYNTATLETNYENVTVINFDDSVKGLNVDINAPIEFIHTNACGDFTLLAKEAWEAIGGYPEFEAFSFNIDSIGIIAAHYGGFTEISLLPPCVCFHIEHSIGSGWTPEGEAILFKKLKEKRITNPEWPVLMPLVEKMRAQLGVPLVLNDECWGLRNFSLPEGKIGSSYGDIKDELLAIKHLLRHSRSGAIKPFYDLDYLAVHTIQPTYVNIFNDDETPPLFQLFIPNQEGEYCEELSHRILLPTIKKIEIPIVVKEWDTNIPLRLDFLNVVGRMLLEEVSFICEEPLIRFSKMDGKTFASSILNSSGCVLSVQGKYLLLRSTSDDPQVVFLPEKLKNIGRIQSLTITFRFSLRELSH